MNVQVRCMNCRAETGGHHSLMKCTSCHHWAQNCSICEMAVRGNYLRPALDMIIYMTVNPSIHLSMYDIQAI